jgi:hypothetical protein
MIYRKSRRPGQGKIFKMLLNQIKIHIETSYKFLNEWEKLKHESD